MGASTDVLFLALLTFCIFATNKACYLTSDGISITLDTAAIFSHKKETHMYSSMWSLKENSKPSSAFFILLLIAGDVEYNPGPYDSAELQNLLDSRGIKLFHLNVCDLFSKISEILLFLQNTSKVDFLLLSETHITKSCYSNNESLYAVPGYTFIHRQRNKGKGGRVGA